MTTYRPNVCAVLTGGQAGQVLVFRRIDVPGGDHRWQFPQGGLKPGESPEQGLSRELREEIGTDQVEVLQRLPQPIRYTYPPEVQALLAEQGSRLGGYLGQEQHWFLARLLVDTSAIRLDAHNAEFDAFQWVTPPEAVARVIPFKQAAYVEALTRFGLLEKEGGES